MKQGDIFRHSFTVSEEVYSGFVNLFKDKNILHTNKDFALSKGFTGVVMHGNILNGFLSFFVGELLPQKNVIIQTQSIKYIKPVYLGDTLEFKAEVAGVYESVNTFEFNYVFTSAQQQKVARGTMMVGII